MTVAPPPKHSRDLPPIARAAFLLDIDGTLLDFAPAPDLVVVPTGLPPSLRALGARLGGAMGLISGRPVAEIDALFPGLGHAVAGEHGAALRPAPGAAPVRADLPMPPPLWRARAAALVAAHPGTLLEDKSRGFVLHFRRVPEAGPVLHDTIAPLVATDARFELMAAAMAWEVRARGVDKGAALRAVMALPPFAGRTPLFIGDDVTDRDAIAAAQAMGGVGLLVGEVFGAPAGVRAWLARAVVEAAWPNIPTGDVER